MDFNWVFSSQPHHIPSQDLSEFLFAQMQKVKDAAWGNGEAKKVQVTVGNDIIELSGYIFEDGYEYFTSTASISLNGTILYALHSRNTAPYRYQTYNQGSYNSPEAAIRYLQQQYGNATKLIAQCA